MSRYIKGKPDFADCEKCSRTYGTLGCCSTVSNEWVYSCLEGMLEKAYADGIKSVEPKRGEWTYCSERMPAETGAYLCLTEIPTVIAYRRIKIGAYHDINGWMLDDVIAWMPLPKLWEGADDE